MSSRPTPRQALSLGGHNRKIIHVFLKKFPPAIFARVNIGDPPVEVWLHIDTGSDLTWVTDDSRVGYDPLDSSTFSYRSCDGLSKSPSVTPSRIRGQCDYVQRLADDAVYAGTLGNETFTFETGDGGIGMLKNVLFGVGKTVAGMATGMGTLGLSLGELSIIKSIGTKFSICVGNFNYISQGKHFLALGDDALLVGRKILLDTKGNTYRIKLSSITIEGQSLGIENVLSKTKSILDTGTSTISLVQEVYPAVAQKIKKIMSDAGYEESDIYKEHKFICYKGVIPEQKKLQVSLKFGKVSLDMDSTTLFIQLKSIAEEVFCLSVNESPIEENLIGIPIFQNHNIGFDTVNNKLYIKPVKFPGGYVTIWWDIMNETRGSYSANVTIIDYLKNHDIDGPWALSWEWAEDEILLNSTVGAIGTQLGNDSSVGDNKWLLNSNLPPRWEKVSKYCKGGVIPSWCTIEADLPKSSSSFQITVGRVGIEYYPPAYVDFTTPRSNFMCFSMMPFTKRRGYLKTWRAECGLLRVPQD
ncbi:unnamed protein product [Brassica rapa]|uniref:Peptidase A1 domain-containing protein n=1 Tax=Brassica campestris TaxID=3711 RepID=A0A8D9H5S6_BRACM|nr:unnamed protein product [Brassica rapa]